MENDTAEFGREISLARFEMAERVLRDRLPDTPVTCGRIMWRPWLPTEPFGDAPSRAPLKGLRFFTDTGCMLPFAELGGGDIDAMAREFTAFVKHVLDSHSLVPGRVVCAGNDAAEARYADTWKAYHRAVWDILVASCGASKAGRDDFVAQAMQQGYVPEYRFQGELGFGGKVHMEGPPRVSCYGEDENPRRLRTIDDANELLAKLWEEYC